MYENSFTFANMLAAYARPHRFTGRSTRTEVLGYFIIAWVVGAAIQWALMIGGIAISFDLEVASLKWLNILFWLPFPALVVRRFHDQDKPGWFGLALIVPTIAGWFDLDTVPALATNLLAIVYLAALVLLFWKPTDGTNRYGPDPRLHGGLQEVFE